MNWHEGSINQAITEAKSRSALFVVVVHGPREDEVSKKFLSDLDQIAGELQAAQAVCIKLEAGSQLCSQFAQIYPVVLVPAVFFINSLSGVDLEITGGDRVDPEKLRSSLQKALSDMNESTGKMDSKEDIKESEKEKPVEANDAQMDDNSAEDDPMNNEDRKRRAEKVLEERVARAKALLAAKKAKRAQEESENEKTKELERRELGKKIQEMKRKQEEDEIRRLAEERKKEKEEARIAKEKIKAQIEQDRLEKEEKFKLEKQSKLAEAEERRKAKLLEEAKAKEKELRERASISRIQFRLPEGQSQTKQFNPEDNLEQLYIFVANELRPSFNEFSLSTAFPSRQLDKESRSKTLRELDLVPSATLLVIPKPSTSSPGTLSTFSDGSLMSLFWLLMTPFTILWSMVMSFIRPSPPRRPSNSTQARSSSEPPQTGRRNPPPRRNLGAIRKEGNVARLGAGEDDDDETNTYNGNSTQQM